MVRVSGPLPRFGTPLVPVVVQDASTEEVLMLAYANQLALQETLRSGEAHFWSRSRNELWRKGATSGNVMAVVEVLGDCDADALLYRVRPAGPACHTGARSCFRTHGDESPFGLPQLAALVRSRATEAPEGSYTARLLATGARRPAEKVVEEAGELAAAALAGSDDEVRNEAADLAYHLLVLLTARGIGLDEIERVLADRHAARPA